MRRRASFLAVLILVALGISLTIYRPTFSRPQTKPCALAPCGKGTGEVGPREFDFAYYSIRDGFDSTLRLVSDSPQPIDFVVSVHNLRGRTVDSSAMTIQPQENLALDLGRLVGDMGAETDDFAEGSVSVHYQAVTMMPLLGQITITNSELHLSYESYMVQNNAEMSDIPPVLNAMWWGLGQGRDATIAVSNTAAQRVKADVYLDFQGSRHPSRALDLHPHETKVLSIMDLLDDFNMSPAQAPEGGITIVPRRPTATLIAQGRILDATTGFSTTLEFPAPHLQRASTLHAIGVPVGTRSEDSPFDGTGNFIPHVIVRNLTASDQNVTITIDYPGEKGAEQTALPPFAVQAYSTADFSLGSALAQLPLPLPHCALRIEYSGAPGSAIAQVSSIEQNEDFVIDSRVQNERSMMASGANPWHLDDETESILFFSNMSEQEVPVGFQVYAQGIHYYLTNLRLKPHEIRAIDLRKLRDAQKPDYKGNKIPPGATDGTVSWLKIGLVPIMGKLLVLQSRRGMASNYDCGCP